MLNTNVKRLIVSALLASLYVLLLPVSQSQPQVSTENKYDTKTVDSENQYFPVSIAEKHLVWGKNTKIIVHNNTSKKVLLIGCDIDIFINGKWQLYQAEILGNAGEFGVIIKKIPAKKSLTVTWNSGKYSTNFKVHEGHFRIRLGISAGHGSFFEISKEVDLSKK